MMLPRNNIVSILYFDTSALPDNAVIRSVTLKIYQAGVVGTDPLTLTAFGSLLADIKKGTFGTGALEKGDFQATASASAIGISLRSAVDGTNWLSMPLTTLCQPDGGDAIPPATFSATSNKNNVADYDTFYAGMQSKQTVGVDCEYTLPIGKGNK